MRYFHKTQNQFHCPVVNVDKLWSLTSEAARQAPAGKVPVIDIGNAVRSVPHHPSPFVHMRIYTRTTHAY